MLRVCRNSLNAAHIHDMAVAFYDEDVPRMLGPESENRLKPRQLYSDIGHYMREVCHEIAVLFPSAKRNSTQILNIMKQSLHSAHECRAPSPCTQDGTSGIDSDAQVVAPA